MLFHQEPGAVFGGVLLVGGERQHQVTGGAHTVAGPVPHHREQHRHRVLHVDRAAPPQHPVAHLPGERRHRPLGGVGGHHVQVTVHEQGGRAG
jgi:hypothetical protein